MKIPGLRRLMPKPTTTTSKYFLPNGKEWNGDVHQMQNGTWMTGEYHSPYSVYLARAFQILNFPEDGFVATQDIFSKIFSNTAFSSRKLEEEYTNLDLQLIELEKTIEENKEKVNASLGRLTSHLTNRTSQQENKGTGTIVDSDIKLILPIANSVIHTPTINSISFIPAKQYDTYIIFGNAETGLIVEGEWLRAKETRTFVEMISRINPSGEVPLIDAYPELDLSSILKIPITNQVGFEGKIHIEFSSQVLITQLYIPLNSTASVSNIQIGQNYVYEPSVLQPIVGSLNIAINPQRVKYVSFDIQYTEPLPFNSQIYVPLIENEDGSPEAAIEAAEDFIGDPQAQGPEFIELVGDLRVYQKTRLELGKIIISSRAYKDSNDFISTPYYCKDGTLKSIYFEATEQLETEEALDRFFNYFITINGTDYPIGPSNRDTTRPRLYYINSGISKEAKSKIENETGYKFITTEEPVVFWTLKTSLTKGPLEAYLTPEVRGFKFIYTTSLDGGINV